MRIDRFENLDCWKSARELTRTVYTVTNQGSFARDFGLRDQIRRASVSVMSNIAEGFESRTKNLLLEFLGRSKGSAAEVRCQLYVAFDAEYISKNQFDALYDLADKTIRQISNFMQYLADYPSNDRIRDALDNYAEPVS